MEVATDDFNWRSESGDTVVFSSSNFDETTDRIVIRSALPVSDESRQMLRLRFTLDPDAP